MTDGNPRSHSWKWLVCGLLLLATMLNYMDRMTLNQLGPRIMKELKLDEVDYGRIESAFAIAFACGALLSGWLADRINIRWFYPAVVLAWSAAGFATGFASGFYTLIACRFLLGLCEAGHWPCALRTTQRILPPDQRTMGNSMLQSGAALGAVLTPPIIVILLRETGDWRYPFWVIGTFGMAWVVLWVLTVRSSDLALPPRLASQTSAPHVPLTPLQIRRFLALVILVVTINASWHFFRAWLPLFLQLEAGYSEEESQFFLTGYYFAADVGTLSAGVATLLLVRRGFRLHRTRLMVFAAYALLLVPVSVGASLQPSGPMLLVMLLTIGFAALGVFPVYYSLSQELTTKHQGKLSGTLGCCNWIAMAILHEVVGQHVKATQSYRTAIALAGLAPLAGCIALVFLWGPDDARRDPA